MAKNGKFVQKYTVRSLSEKSGEVRIVSSELSKKIAATPENHGESQSSIKSLSTNPKNRNGQTVGPNNKVVYNQFETIQNEM